MSLVENPKPYAQMEGKVAIVPIAEGHSSADMAHMELYSGWAVGFGCEGFDAIKCVEDFDKASDKVYLWPSYTTMADLLEDSVLETEFGDDMSYLGDIIVEDAYLSLCHLALEAVRRGYRLQAVIVGD